MKNFSFSAEETADLIAYIYERQKPPRMRRLNRKEGERK